MTIQVENLPISAGQALPSTKRKRKAGSSGAANDCFACQKKSQPCDRVRPYCGQCLQLGVECSGYKTVLTWGVGVASRGKLRGQALPVKKTDGPLGNRLSTRTGISQAATSPLVAPEQRNTETRGESFNKRSRDSSYRGPAIAAYSAYPIVDGISNGASADAVQTASTTRGSCHSLPTWPSHPSSFGHAHFPHAIYGGANHSENSSPVSSSHYDVMNSITHVPHFDERLRESSGYQSFSAPGRRPILHNSTPPPVSFPVPEDTPDFQVHNRVDSGSASRNRSVGHEENQGLEDITGHSVLSHSQTSMVWEVDPRLVDHAQCVEDRMLHSAELTPRPSTFSLLDPFTHLPPRMRYIMDFYDKAICPVLVASDGPTNPYRMHILQLALDSQTLQNAIAALVTNNIRMREIRDTPQIKNEIDDGLDGIALDTPSSPGNASPEEQHHKAKSIEHLNMQLTSNNRLHASSDTVLATLLILCLFHVCNSGFSKFKTQLAGVQKLLRMRNSSGSKSNFVGWIETFFAWFDVMTSAVNDRELEIRGDSLDMDDMSANLGALEQFSGCDGRLFKIIARLSRLNLLSQNRHVHDSRDGQPGLAQHSGLARKASSAGDFYNLDFENDPPLSNMGSENMKQLQDFEAGRQLFWQEWTDTRDRLWAWRVQSPLANSGDSSSSLPPTLTLEEKNMVDLSEAFRYSALIYVERLAHPDLPSSSHNFQDLVQRSLSHIEAIGVGSCVTKFMLWPMFITGTECTREGHRNLIRDRCLEIQRESGFYNNLSGLRVLERVWKEADGLFGSATAPLHGQAFRWRLAMDRLDGEYIVI